MKAYIKPACEIVKQFGRDCVKHPANVETSSWHRFTVAIITSGQPRAYADSVYQADICFEGGGHSTKAGIDNPFFTKPHEDRVRALARWLTGAKESPGAYDTQLTECKCIEESGTHSIWRITAVSPFCG